MDFHKDGILVIDNFFPEKICEDLRKFALFPPKQHHDLYGEYKAMNFDIYPPEFSLKKLVDECVLPKLNFLENITYDRSWCFVYDNKSNGVPAHADPSFVNLNVWLTPNESVNDFKKNGLKLYHKIVDDNVSYHDYNSKSSKFTKEQIKNSQFTIVPYKYNRAVLFLGKMFHETMGVDMKDGHNNRRVSYTFLFNN